MNDTRKMKPGWKCNWDMVVMVCLFSLYARGWGLPLYLLGGSGIGKTKRLQGAATGLDGFEYESMSPAVRGAGAFAAIPVPKNGYLEFPPADFLRKFWDTKRGLLVIDEMSCTPAILHPAVMDLFQEKCLGGHFMGEGVRVFATANPPELAAAEAVEMAPSVWNRLMRFYIGSPRTAEYAAFRRALRNAPTAVEAAAIEQAVKSQWDDIFNDQDEHFCRFLDDAEDTDLCNQPAADDPAGAGPWPSPRSWDMVLSWLTGCKIHGADEITRYHGIRAAVGDVAASKWVAWESRGDLPTVDDVLFGRVSDINGRGDQIHAVLAACISRFKGGAMHADPCDGGRYWAEEINNFWECLIRVSGHHKDSCMDAVFALFPEHRNTMYSHTKEAISRTFLNDLAGELD